MERAAELVGVLHRDIRDDRDLRRDDIRRVERAAEADLDDGVLDLAFREVVEAQCREHLELRRALRALCEHHLDFRTDDGHALSEVLLADVLPVDADALGVRDEMRRAVEARMDTAAAQGPLDHRRDRALAIRARHVDRAVAVLRHIQKLQEPLDAREPQADAKDLEPFQIGNGFLIIHIASLHSQSLARSWMRPSTACFFSS